MLNSYPCEEFSFEHCAIEYTVLNCMFDMFCDPCGCSQVMLEQMQGLMHLELSGCNDFTEAGLWSSLNARLTSLSVSDCINVADDAIAAISQLLPNLSELSLQAYHVTDTAMAYFTAKQVRHLGLDVSPAAHHIFKVRPDSIMLFV